MALERSLPLLTSAALSDYVRLVRASDSQSSLMTLTDFLTNLGVTFLSILETSVDTTIDDDDGYGFILVTTGATDKTITMPTLSANPSRRIVIIKVDSGAGSVIVDGEGSEKLNDTETFEITDQWGFVDSLGGPSIWNVLGLGGVFQRYLLTSGVVDSNTSSGGVWTHFSAAGNDSDAKVSLPGGKWRVNASIQLDAVWSAAQSQINVFTSLSTDDPPSAPTEVYQKFTGNDSTQYSAITQQNKQLNFSISGVIELGATAKDLHIIGLVSGTPDSFPTNAFRISVRTKLTAERIA